MATKTIRIGSAENIIQYDSGDYDSGIEVDAPIKADTPVDPNDVIRLEDLTGRLLNPTSVVNIANPTELNSIAGVLGAMILAYQIVGAGGLNVVTLYVYDASGPAVSAPYIMDADGAGSERWIAVAGRYAVQNFGLLGSLNVGNIVAGNYCEIKTNGEIELHGTARVGNDLFVSPSGIKAPTVKPATWVDHGIGGAWQFADGDDKTLVINYRIPHRMDITVAPHFHIKWSTAGAAAGNCEWQVEYLYRSPNEDTTVAAQDTENITVASSANANGLVVSSTLGLDLPIATDRLLQLRLKRLAAGLNDTIAGTVELHGIDFHFISNKLGVST